MAPPNPPLPDMVGAPMDLGQQMTNLRIEMAILTARVTSMELGVQEIKANYATRDQVAPLKWLVNSLVGALIFAFIGGVFVMMRGSVP